MLPLAKPFTFGVTGHDIKWKKTQAITEVPEDSGQVDTASAARYVKSEDSAEVDTPSATRGTKREDW